MDDAARSGIGQRFSYHRAVAPMLWVLVLLGCGELVVVHLLLALWHPMVALVVSLLTLPALVWLVLGIRVMKRRPVLIDGGRLVMRVGTIRSVEVPLDQIAGLREAWTAADLKRRQVLNLALVAYPNVVVDLAGPLSGKRGIVAIAHRLDEPVAFAAAIKRVVASA
ncbi:hypothetical protein GGQ80_003156 [Sphingomonas jinjuensis]|uniref:DUF304 domain-containing protein n=1 Tax=Sphingomonas jinjuensis TaxID=535907 RepID=A0A840FMU0_9SPHN|nr:hypothetical protein [Sphingomonas jinjuensis]MBB4155238.1 hypothetical protein [Sphingomonas jinjuensis]